MTSIRLLLLTLLLICNTSVAELRLGYLDVEIQKEQVVHECGVAMIRLRKPISYYSEHYDDPAWGVKKLMSLMERQRNRGQDGAGIAVVKFDTPPGQEYLHRERSASEKALEGVFDKILEDLEENVPSDVATSQEQAVKGAAAFLGELLLGHLRYATHSGYQVKCCQPYVRDSIVACKHFALAGNFNMTNTSELFQQLEEHGLSTTSTSDTQVILDTIAFHLDREYQRIEEQIQDRARARIEAISQRMDITRMLTQAAEKWDGGYVFCGVIGNGDAFVCRDPAGIRPGYYYLDDDVFAVASERVALMDAFDLEADAVKPITPGHVIVIKRNGEITDLPFTTALPERQCVFERIYFSRASDPDIYEQRKELGRQLAPRILQALEGDLEHAVFTYVPNSSLAAFQGLVEMATRLSIDQAIADLQDKLDSCLLTPQDLSKLADISARTEYLVAKNQKLRTFISADQKRKNLVAQLYEVTKGVVTPDDTLVVIDDSIVRGTTLRESLITKLASLNPKKIIIASSAPPVMYPDCYGIDMSQLSRFVTFQATLQLLRERGESHLLETLADDCQEQLSLPNAEMTNPVKDLYAMFTLDEISAAVARQVTPKDIAWKGELQIIYQTITGLRDSMPSFTGDWVFSGDYPTPGGYRVINTSFVDWKNGVDKRAY